VDHVNEVEHVQQRKKIDRASEPEAEIPEAASIDAGVKPGAASKDAGVQPGAASKDAGVKPRAASIDGCAS